MSIDIFVAELEDNRDGDGDTASNREDMYFVRQSKKIMSNDWVRQPKKLEEMIDKWLSYKGKSVGYCLVCDSVIRDESEIIPGTNDHRCRRKAPTKTN